METSAKMQNYKRTKIGTTLLVCATVFVAGLQHLVHQRHLDGTALARTRDFVEPSRRSRGGSERVEHPESGEEQRAHRREHRPEEEHLPPTPPREAAALTLGRDEQLDSLELAVEARAAVVRDLSKIDETCDEARAAQGALRAAAAAALARKYGPEPYLVRAELVFPQSMPDAERGADGALLLEMA